MRMPRAEEVYVPFFTRIMYTRLGTMKYGSNAYEQRIVAPKVIGV